jgi:hypothetical protein
MQDIAFPYQSPTDISQYVLTLYSFPQSPSFPPSYSLRLVANSSTFDEVCIVQDDPEDWKRESSLMSAVYGGSALNIAATAARDGSDGCFFQRPRHWRCQLSDEIDGFIHCYEAVTVVPLRHMPLLHRGWALQERRKIAGCMGMPSHDRM